jgi:hypothetical protein
MGRWIESEAVSSGRNQDRGSRKDNEFIRCSRCRFICQISRDPRAPYGSRQGWGTETKLSGSTDYNDYYVKYNQDDIEYDNGSLDSEVRSGCPQCGTFLYK